MAKKKGGARQVSPVKRQPKRAVQTMAPRTKSRPAAGASRAVKPARAKTKKPAAPRKVSLGRPKVTGEELLFLLFKEDYHAREVFNFLKVERVKELEQYSPQQIVEILSRPVTETVKRIRLKLAAKNRCLAGDEAFAAEHQTDE